jgi:hypothetical protein
VRVDIPGHLTVCAWMMLVTAVLDRQRVAAMAMPGAGIARSGMPSLWPDPGLAASRG